VNGEHTKPVESLSEDQRLPDQCWIWRRPDHHLEVNFTKPPDVHHAVKYMRVLSRDEVERQAADDGVDVQQMINSLRRTIEGQRREIRGLNEALRRKASDEAPSFSPNFDERNSIR